MATGFFHDDSCSVIKVANKGLHEMNWMQAIVAHISGIFTFALELKHFLSAHFLHRPESVTH